MSDFERKVLSDLAELKAHMRWVVGNGNEGKIQELEARVQRHESYLQRYTGIVAALGGLLTLLHVAVDWLKYKRGTECCDRGRAGPLLLRLRRIFQSAISNQQNITSIKELHMNFVAKLLQGISFLPTIIQGVEGLFGNKTGDTKKNAALAIVQSAISVTDAVTNKQIVDGSKFQDGLGKVIDGVVDCMNASVWNKKPA